jgi:DNA-binding NtrC family response regulator
MIVQQDLEHGIKLADWLAAHGYQAVLVRSVESAIDECKDLNPQVVFIGLSPGEPVPQFKLRQLLQMIEIACPGISVVTMGHRVSGKTIQVVTSEHIRHVLITPIDLAHIGRLLQAELNRATVSRTSSGTGSDDADEWPIENFSQGRAVQEEAATWIG